MSGSASYLTRDHYAGIVVGSGFGGAVSACRLAQAGLDVAIVERGRRWTPGTFPRDLSKLETGWLWQHRHGLYDARPTADVLAVRAAGYGGGSLLYANVAMRPPPDVFSDAWPEPYRRDFLDPYFDLAAHMLEITPVPKGQTPPKTAMMSVAAERLGGVDSLFRPNLAIRFAGSPEHPGVNRFGVAQGECINCGQCDIGCNVGAKNTLDLNYLAVAEQHGAEVGLLTEVTSVARVGERYELQLHQHGDGGTRRVVTADTVVLAAGALGSTEILLRSRDQFGGLPDLSPALGEGYSANGDFLAFGDGMVDLTSPGTGPTITTAYKAETEDGDWFLVEDGGYSAELATLVQRLQPLHALAAAGRRSPDHDLALLAMGRDRADGRVVLTEPRHHLHIEWDAAANRTLYNAQQRVCSDIVHAFDGHPSTPPTWRYLHRPVSVHSLGGCRMSADPSAGVVDVDGQVHGYPGLYVLDGAVLPAATGVNPSHTITAVAERCIELVVRRLTGQPDWTAPERADARRPALPEDYAVTATIPRRAAVPRVTFDETMTGTARVDGGSARPADVVLTIDTGRLDDFIADPAHSARVTGRVRLPPLTGPSGAHIDHGVLHLLARTGERRARTMTYVLPFDDRDGRRWELAGHKDVRHRRGLDVWAATTTLRLTLTGPDGEQDPDAGILRLTPMAFAREMMSMRGRGAGSIPGGLRLVAQFLGFFLARVSRAFLPFLRPSGRSHAGEQ